MAELCHFDKRKAFSFQGIERSRFARSHWLAIHSNTNVNPATMLTSRDRRHRAFEAIASVARGS